MKVRSFVLAMLTVSVVGSLYSVGSYLNYRHDSINRSVLAVNANGACTAFPVAPGKYLSAKHCMPVSTVGDLTVIEHIPHPSLDIVLLVTAPDNAPWTKDAPKPLRLARVAPGFGDPLRVAGYARGQYRGVWAGFQGSTEMPPYRLTSIEGQPGLSGSPVLDRDGRVVGVLSKMFVPFGHPAPMSLYVPVEAFRDWLKPLL